MRFFHAPGSLIFSIRYVTLYESCMKKELRPRAVFFVSDKEAPCMAQYTQKAILATFTDMLRKMPFDKITVSALAAACEISPNTFYYHYRDIYNLLDAWLAVMRDKYFLQPLMRTNWRDAVRVLLHTMRDNAAIAYHLFDSLSRERLERYVFDSSDDTFYRLICQEPGAEHLPDSLLRYVAEYTTYSFLGFLMKFLWRHMEADIDEATEKLDYIVKGNIAWAVRYHEEHPESFRVAAEK